MAEKLDLIVTPEARTRIEEFIATSDLPGCMVGLLQTTDGRWSIGGYDKAQVATLKRMYEKDGFGLIYEVDGLEQDQLLLTIKTFH